MDRLTIKAETKIIKGEVNLTASKSESNRVLIIRALCERHFPIHNLAAAKDTETMVELLANEGTIKDVGPAGHHHAFPHCVLCKHSWKVGVNW